MNRLPMPRLFPMTLAPLALLVVPFGCGSDTQTTAEVPTPPAAVADAPPARDSLAPMPGTPPGAVEPPGTLDQSVRQAAVDVKGEANQDAAEARKDVREAEGDAKKAIEDAEGEAKHKAKAVEAEAKRKAEAIEADARKAAEDALEKLLPTPK